MVCGEDSVTAYAAIGASLEQAREQVLDAYRAGLVERANPVVFLEGTWRQAQAQAQAVITDVIAALNGVDVDFVRRAEMLSGEIGAARAASSIHQNASLEAAGVLFRTILHACTAATTRSADPVGALETVAVVLNESLTARVREGAAAYSSFLLDKVHDAQIDERRRIARDLHDRVGAGITVVHRQLEYALLVAAPSGVLDVNAVETTLDSIKSVLAGLRQLTAELRLTEPLDSLETALCRFADESCPDGGSEVVVQVSGDETWASPVVRDETFLIVREAIRNALQHNEQVRVVAHLEIAPHALAARVYDDGRGFRLTDDTGATSSGLATMRERATLLGGEFDISSDHGDGTAVRLLVPLGGDNKRSPGIDVH
jgi:signal transduction histidine kinase